MQLDRKKVRRLLDLSDEQLSALIRQVAADSGIDPAMLGIRPESIQSVRQALENATDEDIRNLSLIYEDYKQKRRKS